MTSSAPPRPNPPPASRAQDQNQLDRWIEEAEVGAKDSDGYEVAKIYARNIKDGFLVYETKDHDVRMNGKPLDPEMLDASLTVSNQTRGDIDLIRRFNPRRAHALHLFLRGEVRNAVAAMHLLAKDIEAYRTRRTQGVYVAGALSMLLLISLLAFMFRAFWWVEIGAFWRHAVCGIAYGALGGTLSCVTGSGRVVQREADGASSAFYNGALRTTVGIMFGGAAIVLMHADLALSFLKASDLYGTSAAALLAGFSEKLVPDAMKSASRKDD